MLKSSLLALSIASIISTTALAASKVEFVYYYGPGGGTDLFSTPVIDGYASLGVTTTKTFLPSCSEAVKYAEAQPHPTYVVTSSHDFHPTIANRCPALSNTDLEYVTSIASAPIFLCTTPNNNELVLTSLSDTRILVGSTTSDVAMMPIRYFSEYNTLDINLTVIPYANGGDVRVATLAGKDIQLAFMSSGLQEVLDAGGVCLAASSAGSHNLPTFTELTNPAMPDVYVDFSLFSSNHTDDTELTTIMKSAKFAEFISYRYSYTHNGFGANNSSADQHRAIADQHLMFDHIR